VYPLPRVPFFEKKDTKLFKRCLEVETAKKMLKAMPIDGES